MEVVMVRKLSVLEGIVLLVVVVVVVVAARAACLTQLWRPVPRKPSVPARPRRVLGASAH
ncbi:hypothetical protein E2C01_060697 [Portunus trituberculatus]|uniref:Uncharacterized protein n=1 Tax=Portunus trituberculatus TaxID=210409 RepID=A0A5B7HC66_PORTR|nr:hypothetical protein [Portunus trituberculatus]